MRYLCMLILTLCIPAIPRPLLEDPFVGLLDATSKQERIQEAFFGLHFNRDKNITTCVRQDSGNVLRCQVMLKGTFGQMIARAEFEFSKQSLGSKAAISLVRLNRKRQWMRQFSSLNHYVEQPITLGAFSLLMQQAQYLRLNNSFWPVLLRAVDVVVNERTCISVTISADVNDWPLVEKELDYVVRSFSKKS